jgi:CCR4-NOT transcription complex subunit 6
MQFQNLYASPSARTATKSTPASPSLMAQGLYQSGAFIPPTKPGYYPQNQNYLGMSNLQHVPSIAQNANMNSHIQKQLDAANVSRNSANPHHHARIARTTGQMTIKGVSLTDSETSSTLNGTQADGEWSTLDLGGMLIQNLSKELFRYNFLTTLYINHNQLSTIPSAISQLRALTKLDASGNRLTTLPPEIGLLSNLKELLLFDNQLSILPPELGTLYQLENLGLEGNPIQDPVLSIFQKEGTTGVIQHLRDSCPRMYFF